MSQPAPLQADAEAIESFVQALFRYAEPGSYVSLRVFGEKDNDRPQIEYHQIADSRDRLNLLSKDAIGLATQAAQAAEPRVFCPPVATFKNAHGARETDLANGLALSLDCDVAPNAGRQTLESILGPATVVVASGGQWTDPITGEIQPKLHLHWRLTEVTQDQEGHAMLKRARAWAACLVNGDASNTPLVHPIRWPGSWHRKKEPQLVRILELNETREIDLQDALERLQEAAKARGLVPTLHSWQASPTAVGEPRKTSELVAAILSADEYHRPLVSLAMRELKRGTSDAQAVEFLRGIMLAIPEVERDIKDGLLLPGRWQSRFDDIPRAVSSARVKIGERSAAHETDILEGPALLIDADTWAEEAIPKRPWLAPGYLMRGAVSALSGQGSGGKSSLVVRWSIALATGQAVGVFRPTAALRVVNYNVEDDEQEQRRRYSAALRAAKRVPTDIHGKVIRCGPQTIGTLFERNPHNGHVLPTAAMESLETLCKEKNVDVLVCDPLAELHNAEENDNTAMRAVVAAFRTLAQRLDIAVLLLHHDRKGNNAPGDMDRLRGASAISGAVRVLLTLTSMSEADAERFSIPPEKRRQYFRIDGAKSNYAIAQDAEWWRLAGYQLTNGEEVAACSPWAPPSPFEKLSMADWIAALESLNAGTPAGHAWAAMKQAKDQWGGRILMEGYGLTESDADRVLAGWIKADTVSVEMRPGPRERHLRKALIVNPTSLAEMRRQNLGGTPQ